MQNKGLACARNTGMRHAVGEYIFFLDSDDYLYDETVLERCYLEAKRMEVDVLVTKLKPFAENPSFERTVVGLRKYLDVARVEKLRISAENFLDANYKFSAVACGKLFKREFLVKNELNFISARVVHEDNGFAIKVLSAFPMISASEMISICYRIRAGSITSEINDPVSMKQKNKNMRKALADAFAYIKGRKLRVEAKKMIRMLKQSELYYFYFDINYKPFFAISWMCYKKYVKLFGVTLFKWVKTKQKEESLKILYCPIYTNKIFN